jgi:hypothetical protein
MKVWRRGRDSNPRYPLRYVRFRGGSFQPLTHLSTAAQPFNCEVPRAKRALGISAAGSQLRIRSASRPLSASTFEADRFNRSRTSPKGSRQLSVVGRQEKQIPRCARNDKSWSNYPPSAHCVLRGRRFAPVPRNGLPVRLCGLPFCGSVGGDLAPPARNGQRPLWGRRRHTPDV